MRVIFKKDDKVIIRTITQFEVMKPYDFLDEYIINLFTIDSHNNIRLISFKVDSLFSCETIIDDLYTSGKLDLRSMSSSLRFH